MPPKKTYSITEQLDKLWADMPSWPSLSQGLEAFLPASLQSMLAHTQYDKTLPAQAVYAPLGLVLREGAFDRDTAFNLALFSALAYTGDKGPYGVPAVLRSLGQGINPARVGKKGSIPASFIARPLNGSMDRQLFLPTLYSLERQLAVQAHISSNADTAVLFFQGTENVLNIILDSALTPLADTELPRSFQALLETGMPVAENLLAQLPLGVAPEELNSFFAHKHSIASYLMQPQVQGLHTGFAIIMGAFLHSPSFQSMLRAHNLAEKRVFCTGHSLGGALAALMANSLQSFCHKPVFVYTYGCPRLGEANFVQTMHPRLTHYRLLNNNDPVPWMPDLPAWRSHGQAFWLVDRANTTQLLPQPDSFSVGLPFAEPWLPNPLDHSMRAYVERLANVRTNAPLAM